MAQLITKRRKLIFSPTTLLAELGIDSERFQVLKISALDDPQGITITVASEEFPDYQNYPGDIPRGVHVNEETPILDRADFYGTYGDTRDSKTSVHALRAQLAEANERALRMEREVNRLNRLIQDKLVATPATIVPIGTVVGTPLTRTNNDARLAQ